MDDQVTGGLVKSVFDEAKQIQHREENVGWKADLVECLPSDAAVPRPFRNRHGG